MLNSIDLSRKISKEEYKSSKKELELRLAELQRRAKNLNIPVIVVFEGWNAAGKGTLINNLIQPLDPREFTVFATRPPNQEEVMRPLLWRFWNGTPERGRMTIYDRSWYRDLLFDRAFGSREKSDLLDAFNDIRSFERQLADDGNVIIKFFLHISKEEQHKRFKKLRENSATTWRVTDEDRKRHKKYDELLAISEELLTETDSDFAPWTIVESHDKRFATIKIFNSIISAVEHKIRLIESRNSNTTVPSEKMVEINLPPDLNPSILDGIDLTRNVAEDDYRSRLKKMQKRMHDLEHEIYMRRIPVIIVYQGWDAAGKGGNIKRLTQNMDPRGYEVIPIAAPNDIEKAHHYLWRFWMRIPKAGHIAIFDRSWYGRVLVERVEGFATETEWKRAYREINEMEKHLTHFGTIMLKLWLHIDQDEQLARFKAREVDPHKQWKITEEDWRNREKWDRYKTAVEEMLYRTSTLYAPWTIVESNDKRFARLKVLETVIEAIEARV